MKVTLTLHLCRVDVRTEEVRTCQSVKPTSFSFMLTIGKQIICNVHCFQSFIGPGFKSVPMIEISKTIKVSGLVRL